MVRLINDMNIHKQLIKHKKELSEKGSAKQKELSILEKLLVGERRFLRIELLPILKPRNKCHTGLTNNN